MIRILSVAALFALFATGAGAQTFVPGHVGPNGVYVPGHVQRPGDGADAPQSGPDGYANPYQHSGPQPRTTDADDSNTSPSAYAPVSARAADNGQDLGDRYRVGPGGAPGEQTTRASRGYRDGT